MWGFVGISNINKENTDELITLASLDVLSIVLEQYGYNITKTQKSISANYGGVWSTNGHISNITIIDCGEYRKCINKETSQGMLCSPVQGRLAKIISIAESVEEKVK